MIKTLKDTSKITTPLNIKKLSESKETTEFNPQQYAESMVKYHSEQLQHCLQIYNKTSKQVQKHETMLQYYQQQINKG